MLAFIKIGFLEIRLLDIIDIALVGLLIYQLYRLLRGSLAFNIFIGLLLVYLAWYLVRAFEMQLLEGILGQFIGVGVIALLIVFQPEVRRFLLFIGRSSIVRRTRLWRRMMQRNWDARTDAEKYISEITAAVMNFSMSRTGAIIVFADSSRLQFFANSGVTIEAEITSKLLESIFQKGSPLHDGAVIISENKVVAAGCVLPVSENPYLPSRVGLRHRAGVGITEHSDAITIIVSEETGHISYAKVGKLFQKIDIVDLKQVLKMAFSVEE